MFHSLDHTHSRVAENMEDEEDEEMDQTITVGSAPTPVIVSVSRKSRLQFEHHPELHIDSDIPVHMYT